MSQIDEREVYIESILLAKNGAYVTFNIPPYEAFKYIPGVEKKRNLLKNQTTLFFPWVFNEWIVLESMRGAILHDVGQWVYTENEHYRKLMTYRYVFFNGLKQKHASNADLEYRHSRVRQILKTVKL